MIHRILNLPSPNFAAIYCDLWSWSIIFSEGPSPSWLTEADIPTSLYHDLREALPEHGRPQSLLYITIIVDKMYDVFIPYYDQIAPFVRSFGEIAGAQRKADKKKGGIASLWWEAVQSLLQKPKMSGKLIAQVVVLMSGQSLSFWPRRRCRMSNRRSTM